MFNNPQFNQQLFQNFQKAPSVEKLWEDEKSKYRVWILLFGIGVFVILCFLTVSMTWGLIDKSEIIKKYTDYYCYEDSYYAGNVTIDQAQDMAEQVFNTSYLIYPVIEIIVLLVGFVYYFSSVYNCYKSHSFAKISVISTTIISIGAFLSLFELVYFLFGDTFSYWKIENIQADLFKFINYFIVVFIWLSTLGKVVRIRNTFALSERVEQMKKDPRFQDFLNNPYAGQQSMNSPFGPSYMGNPPNNSNSNTFKPKTSGVKTKKNSQGKETKANVSKKIANEARLLKMSVKQLQEVAKKLSISGYEKMNKKALVETILRFSSD